MFEVYTLVSKIHENIDLILGIKNIFELEGVISLQECCFSFLNRSVTIFPKERIILKPKEQKLVKVDAPFSDRISGLAIFKLLYKLTQSIIMLKVKFMRNAAILDVMNSSSEILILNPKEALGILDLRSLGFYKIKQGILQQKLSKYYQFESAEKLYDQYNNLINTLRKEQNIDSGGKVPVVKGSNERKHMTDREILEKYINLDNTCLTEREKKEVMDMLYKYKGAFSLKDKMHTCPNIEVGIDVTDKSQFFIRPYHVREEDKKVIKK